MSLDRPRIAFVIDDLGHGGAQRQLYLTLRALEDAYSLSVVVLSDLTEPYGPRIRELGIPVDTMPRHAGRAVLLARKFRALRVDIAHAMLEASDAFTFPAARLCRIPAVLSLRSDRFYSTGAKARVLRWAMHRADAVTVNSVAGHDYLRTIGVRDARIHVIPNIVDIPDQAPARGNIEPVIGAVGRLVLLKRFDAVIETLPVVRRAIPGARVVVIGDGPARPGLENLARRLGLAGSVEFLGTVGDAAPHIGTFACLVVASTYEGLPNAALEALAHGVPVVAVPAGDLPRIVRDGVTGVMSRDASPEALGDAIVRALSSPALRETAMHEGPRLVREEFSAARARERLLECTLGSPAPEKISGASPVGEAPDFGARNVVGFREFTSPIRHA